MPTGSSSPSSKTRPPLTLPTKGIEYQHRIFLTGATESGKSTLARELHCSAAPPSVAVDPLASEVCGSIPGVVTFTDPTRFPDATSGRWRFVPRDPFDLDIYDTLFAEINRRLALGTGGGWANCHVLVDEAGDVTPVHKGPKQARRYLYRMAKLMGGAIGCHTRPREVDRHWLTDSAHLGIFFTPDADDRKFIAAQLGVPLATLEQLLEALPPKGFLWFNRIARRLTPCPPLALL